MNSSWSIVLDVVVLLAGATLAGLAAERLRQPAILGYLLAGVLLGPDVLSVVANPFAMNGMAELGVALLLFTIGLEFSWSELRSFGRRAVLVGALQVLLTTLAAAGVARAAGLSHGGAAAMGAVIAVSSTAAVLAVLRDRAELDTAHGRRALTILLVQDLAVVPLVVFVTAASTGGTPRTLLAAIALNLAVAAAVVAGLGLASVHVLPRLFGATSSTRNRDLPILVTVVACLGAAFAAHSAGLSPALGAFATGILLGGSAFATRIRADVGALRAVFVALFFATTGMLASPRWIAANAVQVGAVVAAVLLGKTLLTTAIGMALGQRARQAIATGLATAQIGEFSLVLLGVATAAGLFTEDHRQLVLAATAVTLLLTPALVAGAVPAGVLVERVLRMRGPAPGRRIEAHARRSGHVIVVGLGPAGRGAVHGLQGTGIPIVAIEMNARAVQLAEREGISGTVGDAASQETLRAVDLDQARALVITIPDLRAAGEIIAAARAVAPHVPVLARARYHVHVLPLLAAGASVVVDEEWEMGGKLGRELRDLTVA